MSNPSLKDLTKLGVFSGRVSEVHMKNLQSFPFVFFNGIKEVSIDYDVSQSKEGQSYVKYNIDLQGDNDNVQYRCHCIENAVRSVFWKEINVIVCINETEVYRSV